MTNKQVKQLCIDTKDLDVTIEEKVSIKRKQFELAMQGNVQMLIWLGKQHLGQKDKPVDNSWWDRPIEGFEFIDDGKPLERKGI